MPLPRRRLPRQAESRYAPHPRPPQPRPGPTPRTQVLTSLSERHLTTHHSSLPTPHSPLCSSPALRLQPSAFRHPYHRQIATLPSGMRHRKSVLCPPNSEIAMRTRPPGFSSRRYAKFPLKFWTTHRSKTGASEPALFIGSCTDNDLLGAMGGLSALAPRQRQTSCRWHPDHWQGRAQ